MWERQKPLPPRSFLILVSETQTDTDIEYCQHMDRRSAQPIQYLSESGGLNGHTATDALIPRENNPGR